MKQFIKEHPWRLEIVPFLMVAFNTTAVILNHLPRNSGLRLSGVFIAWLSLIYHNHEWVTSERGRKKNNTAWRGPLTLLWSCGLPLYPAINPWVPLVWFALLPVSWLVLTILEKRRQALPYIEDGVPDSGFDMDSIKPDDRLYYRETPDVVSLSPFAIAGVALYVVTCVVARLWYGFAVLAAAAACAIVCLLWRKFVITRDRIAVRVGFRGVTIPIPKVKTCWVQEYNPLTEPDEFGFFATYDGLRLFTWCSPSDYALAVKMQGGGGYLFTPSRPEKACAVINAILAARREQEAQQ
jgi:hypothetical protein